MRKNKGTHEGKYLGTVLENWSIYETAKGYRAASIAPIVGKANYSFAIAAGKIDKMTNMDAYKLQADRPELYAAIEVFFTGAPVHPSAEDEFGDLALSQGKSYDQLTPVQQWKRALLDMRKYELYWAAKNDQGVWDAGIRMTYSGIFKFKIDDATYATAMQYITKRDGSVDVEALLSVVRNYHDGKYRPSSCATLEAQFDLIAGTGAGQ